MEIAIAPTQFTDWPALLELLRSAYAYMAPRIDPPSSLLSMDVADLQAKAQREVLVLAREAPRILGCAYAAVRDDCVYIGKLAVDESARRRGIARKIVEAVETIARQNAKAYLELETRVELTENHATFTALGFARVAERSHAGFDRPTVVIMRKPVRLEQHMNARLQPFQLSSGDAVTRWARASPVFAPWPSPPTEETFRAALADPQIASYVLLDSDQRSVAYGEIWSEPGLGEVELARIIVDPEVRRRGFGSRLAHELIAVARAHMAGPIWVRVLPNNSAALACYAKLGFVRTSSEAELRFNAQGQTPGMHWLRLES